MKTLYLSLVAATLFTNVAVAKVSDRDIYLPSCTEVSAQGAALTPGVDCATVIKTSAQQDKEYANYVREHEGKGDRTVSDSKPNTPPGKPLGPQDV